MPNRYVFLQAYPLPSHFAYATSDWASCDRNPSVCTPIALCDRTKPNQKSRKQSVKAKDKLGEIQLNGRRESATRSTGSVPVQSEM